MFKIKNECHNFKTCVYPIAGLSRTGYSQVQPPHNNLKEIPVGERVPFLVKFDLTYLYI